MHLKARMNSHVILQSLLILALLGEKFKGQSQLRSYIKVKCMSLTLTSYVKVDKLNTDFRALSFVPHTLSNCF